MGFEQNITNLKKHFTASAVAKRLKRMAPIKTTIMDLVFPPAQRRQHPLAIIGVDEITESTGNIPVVKRGTASYPVDGDTGTLSYIEPQPITPNKFISAKDLNDILVAGNIESVEAFISGKTDQLRKICRRTTEVLAAQSLSGKISYKMATLGGSLVNYEVSYGSTLSLTATDISSSALSAIVEKLEEIYTGLQDQGYGSNVRFLCGSDVYTTILGKAMATNSKYPILYRDYGFVLGGKYKIQPLGDSYILPGDSAATKVVAANKICAIDLSADHTLHYCALDDLDANLRPLPFFTKPIVEKDPSGVKLVGTSKPMPAPDLKAILWREMQPAA